MGHLHGFICTKCGLTALVSGEEDCGFFCNTQTVWCVECNLLQDVSIGYLENNQMHHVTPCCEKCGNEEISIWNEEMPCPFCGGIITRDPDGGDILWD